MSTLSYDSHQLIQVWILLFTNYSVMTDRLTLNNQRDGITCISLWYNLLSPWPTDQFEPCLIIILCLNEHWWCAVKLKTISQLINDIIPGTTCISGWISLILVKGLSKHPLNTYVSGMKIDLLRVFACAFVIITLSVMSFPNFVTMTKSTSFSLFCTFLHP